FAFPLARVAACGAFVAFGLALLAAVVFAFGLAAVAFLAAGARLAAGAPSLAAAPSLAPAAVPPRLALRRVARVRGRLVRTSRSAGLMVRILSCDRSRHRKSGPR